MGAAMKTDTLADWVHAWTYDKRPIYDVLGRIRLKMYKQDFQGWQDAQKLELRQVIRNATRFRLDNEFLSRIAYKSVGQPTDMLAMVNLSQLPFESVFIEYDDTYRNKIMRQILVEHGGTPKSHPMGDDYGRAGMLIERINGSANEWRLTYFSDSELSLPVWPYGVLFSLDRDVRLIEDASGFHYSDFVTTLRASGWGYIDSGDTTGLHYAIHDNLLERGVASPERRFFAPIMNGMLRAAGPRNRVDEVSNVISDLAFEYATEGSGKLRWAVSILSSINVVPTLRVLHKATGHFQHRLRNIPKLDFTTITIDARLGEETRVYERSMGDATGRHNRWHEVRGHWRVVDTQKAGARPIQMLCDHVVADRDGLYGLCGKCGHLIRWIDHHERGD